MEQLKKNVEIIKRKNPSAGGTIYRINLPAAWIREMGISDDNKSVKMLFENNKVIIEKEPE